MGKRNDKQYRTKADQLVRMMDVNTIMDRDQEALIYPGRKCGTCSACCHLPAVRKDDCAEIAKGMCVDCTHLDEGQCGIYADRPRICKEYYCAYMMGMILERPDKCGILWTPKYIPEDNSIHMVGICQDINESINKLATIRQINGLTYWNKHEVIFPLGAIVLRSPKFSIYFDMTSGSGVGCVHDIDPETHEEMRETKRLIQVPWFVNAIKPQQHK